MTKLKWPADSVVRRKVADLVPYARNSRIHSEKQIGQLAASIQEWGWTVPVLIDPSGGIIAGHGRVMAALSLGIADVPCMIAEGWTEAQKRAYVIADNKLAENAEWNFDTLDLELSELGQIDFDVSLVGFEAAIDVVNFTPATSPSMDSREVSESDISTAADRLAAPMGVTVQSTKCICPYCGEGFEFSGS